MKEKIRTQSVPEEGKPVSLRMLAEYLDLSPATISVVLNNVPGRSIPEATRARIREAAKRFNYRPSLVARSLRKRQTLAVGILVPWLNEGYHGQVTTAIADALMSAGYFYFIAHHRGRADLVEEYSNMLIARGAEGIIAVDTHLVHTPAVPVVAIAGHRPIEGVTNVVIDAERAAHLTMKHLHQLGHRDIAFMRGVSSSSDADSRWEATQAAAQKFGIQIRPELVVRLDQASIKPEIAYPFVRDLLRTKRFTAMLCFNDIAALGAIRAIADTGKSVPDDISIVGFDDIPMAAYGTPSLTTIRQPLIKMGETASQILLDRLSGKATHVSEVAIEPELVIRESTAPSSDLVRGHS